MKKLSFVVLLLLSGTAFAQQYPISAFVMFGNPNENPYVPSVATQMQKTPPLMASADFNWGIASVHDMSVTDVDHLLDSAAAHNIKLILADSLEDDFENLTRFYLEGASSYFSTVNGVPGSPDNNSDQPHNDPYYNLEPLETVGTGHYYMVENAKMDPINNWATSPISYEAYFRLKFEGSITPPIEVAELIVYDQATNSVIKETTLVTTDFSASDTYKTFGLSFTDPTHTYNGGQSADGIDVQVYWYGQVPVYLDDIRVDFTGTLNGHTTADLFSGNYDSQIQNMALEYDSYPALGRYWLVDEPGPYQFQTYKYVNSLLRESSPDPSAGTGLGYTQLSGTMRIEQSNWTGDPYKRFATEADPYELTPEVAAFDSGDAQPGASNYVSTVQPELQDEVNRFSQADSNVNLTPSGDFRAHLDMSSWSDTWRAPHVNEVAAEVYDALAHDAKGIDYWDYTSWPPKDNEGLVEPYTLNPINGTSSYAAYPNENRWDFIAAMNQKIESSIGPILMNPNVTFQGAYSINGTASGPYGFASNISTGDPAGSQYVELGEFTDNSGNQYLMVVNRRTDSTQTRSITVTLNNTSPREVQDVSTGNAWIIQADGSFTATYPAGDGEMYRIGPPTLSDTINETDTLVIPANTNVTIDPGTVINFASNAGMAVDGVLTADGTSSQPITMTGIAGVNWGSIIFSNSGADNSSLEYCNISNGDVIEAENTSGITVEHCNITKCSNYGIYLSGSSNFLGEYNTIADSNVYDGILAVGGRTTTSTGTSFTNMPVQTAGKEVSA